MGRAAAAGTYPVLGWCCDNGRNSPRGPPGVGGPSLGPPGVGGPSLGPPGVGGLPIKQCSKNML